MNIELIRMARKAATQWDGTDAYHQAAQIISMLADEIERNDVHAIWSEYDGDDKGFHYCSNCKKASFNYQDGDQVVEVLSDFCPYCGRSMQE